MTYNNCKNTLIGSTTIDTLDNVSAVIMLLKYLKFSGDINDEGEQGLHLIYGLLSDSLQYEIVRLELG